MITALIIAATFFVSGFGFGWCLRGDRYQAHFNHEVRRAHPEVEREILEGLARERMAIERKKQNKERSRWN